MQVANETDEPITIQPGEAVVGSTNVHTFEDVPYRLTINSVRERGAIDNLETPVDKALTSMLHGADDVQQTD